MCLQNQDNIPIPDEILPSRVFNFNFPHDHNTSLNFSTIEDCHDHLVEDENIETGSIASDEALADADLLADGILFENGIGPRKSSGIKLKCGECQKMILANKQWILLNHINSEYVIYSSFELPSFIVKNE